MISSVESAGSLDSGTAAAPRRIRAFDVFNGDADGICALHQLRLACPLDATLVTGVKRDIALVERVPCEPGIEVTVLDVSFDTNRVALAALLEAGAHVSYYDHHGARHAFVHPRLRFYWDDAVDVCTSLIVDRTLGGRFRRWAIVAAFGDNLGAPARALALESGCTQQEIDTFDLLGRVLNYNAYGETIEDLHVAPAQLYHELHPYEDPLDFTTRSSCYAALVEGYRSDVARIETMAPCRTSDRGAIYVLPDASWARRVSGVFANRLAAGAPHRSFAVLTENAGGCYTVSVRSADAEGHPANVLCERFAHGGGRRAAAGINGLPAESRDAFFEAFDRYFAGSG